MCVVFRICVPKKTEKKTSYNVHRKSERKFLFLQRKLEHIQERELTAQETLSQVLTVVSGA